MNLPISLVTIIKTGSYTTIIIIFDGDP